MKIEKYRKLILVGLIILCFALRAYNSGGLSGGDDSGYAAWVYYALEEPSRFIYLSIPDEPVFHQGDHLLRNFSIIPMVPFVLLFGKTAFALRLSGIVFACLSAFILYLFMRRYFDYRITFLAVFLFVVSPLHIAFTKHVLVDSALTFYLLTISYLVTKGIDDKKTYLIYIAGAVALIDMLSTNFRGLLPLFGLLLYIIYAKASKRQWSHMISVGLLVISMYILYAIVPILWNDYGFVNMLFSRLDSAVGKAGLTFFEVLFDVGKYLYFTPFLGLIIVPAAFGLYSVVKDFRKPINALLIGYFLTSLIFYFQGQSHPSRQTIMVPLYVMLAAIGIVWAKDKKASLLILYTSAHLIIMAIISVFFINEFSSVREILSAISINMASILIVVVIALCGILTYIFYKYSIAFRALHKPALALFLLINLTVPVIVVAQGFGIYHRSEAINNVSDFMLENLDDEKYGCVAGIHVKTLTYLLDRQCAYWQKIDVDWLEENRDELRYFLINYEYEYGTVGLGKLLPDGTIDKNFDNVSFWSKNYYDKIDWLMENSIDVSGGTSLGENNSHFMVREIK